MKGKDAFMLVYDVTKKSSLDYVSQLREKILKVKASKAPMVLVGNKSDLMDDREVTTEDGQNLAADWGCQCIETSAKDRVNNRLVFVELIKAIQGPKIGSQPEPRRSKKKKMKCVLL
mmetsp:Transcript_36473/g.67377  ORF Transcript_36473/g.67377 Transcript_36473/m.67377 type:complete len:117 (-) Transcript_36473:299-649(-)